MVNSVFCYIPMAVNIPVFKENTFIEELKYQLNSMGIHGQYRKIPAFERFSENTLVSGENTKMNNLTW